MPDSEEEKNARQKHHFFVCFVCVCVFLFVCFVLYVFLPSNLKVHPDPSEILRTHHISRAYTRMNTWVIQCHPSLRLLRTGFRDLASL